PAYSRTFCGTCNRIRVTPTGTLKTCLYDQGVFNIKDSIRGGANDRQIVKLVQEALAIKAINGVEAEKMRHQSLPVKESMATIGG
ncbi:MAG: cyclic pyranopterin phosphate synthase MoaA, partial [Bacteroidia bacterium]|nr:cyclic pyranopterin phosphate synthase MoaA [Bacteroidia bacterium]